LAEVEVKVLDGTPEPFQRMISPYLVISGDEAVLIDSGPRSASDSIVDQIRSEGVRLRFIILTHIHLDHGGGAGSLYRMLGTVEKVYVHPKGLKHLVDPSKLWEASRSFLGPYADYYGKPEPLPENAVEAPGDGEVLKLLGVEYKILYTPGHASHHMSVMLPQASTVFTGDSAGVSVVDDDGRTRVEVPTNPPPFKPLLYYRSLLRMIEECRGYVERVGLGHYGYAPEGFYYMEKHGRSILRWFKAALESFRSGAGDAGQLAEALADALDEAARAYRASNPVIREFFYMGAVYGLLDAALRGEEFPAEVSIY